VALLAQTHAYVLRLEMNRRALARETALRDAIVEDRQDKLREAAVETKSIENVVEARDEQLAREVALKQQSQLDEFGSVGWWRNSA
jgi:flagellar export protein FliJ